MPSEAFVREQIESTARFLELQGYSVQFEVFPARVYTDILRYLELLLDWGTRMDLVAPAPPVEQLARHFIDCITADFVLRAVLGESLREESGIADIGSGAGFPGMLLALLHRDAPVTLLEPREKRVRFLTEVKKELELDAVQILPTRFEMLSSGFPQEVTLVISRALGSYPQFVNKGRENLLKTGGGVVSAMVGPSFSLAEVKEPGTAAELHSYRGGPAAPQRALALWKVGKEVR